MIYQSAFRNATILNLQMISLHTRTGSWLYNPLSMQNNMLDLNNLATWERNGGYHCKQYFSQKSYCQAMSTK
jgi:hypothetical protein